MFDLNHSVLRSFGYDEVAEHEEVARLRDAAKEIALLRPVEVMDGEHRYDEVERPFGQRILEPLQAQVGVRQPFACALEHRRARVDPGQARVGIPGQDASGRLTGACSELEDISSASGCGHGLLQLLVAGDLLEYRREKGVRIPLEFRYGRRPYPSRARDPCMPECSQIFLEARLR